MSWHLIMHVLLIFSLFLQVLTVIGKDSLTIHAKPYDLAPDISIKSLSVIIPSSIELLANCLEISRESSLMG